MLTALDMCLHMFIAIPLPPGRWDENLRKQSTACLPLLGLLIGAIWLGVAHLARGFLPGSVAAAVIAALPFVLTGFIHLDGYMDASDALLSWRNREERLRILKDVHVGSFAVVMIALLFMLQFAACMAVERLFPLLLIPVLSRAGSALCVLGLKPLGHSEYAGANQRAPRGLIHMVLGMAAAALAALALVCGWRGLAVGGAVVLGYGFAMWRCVRSLGGVSGDLAGFALTAAELCGLIALSMI